MSEYMAMKADQQIEAGIQEQEMLYKKIDELSEENERLKKALEEIANGLEPRPALLAKETLKAYEERSEK